MTSTKGYDVYKTLKMAGVIRTVREYHFGSGSEALSLFWQIDGDMVEN